MKIVVIKLTCHKKDLHSEIRVYSQYQKIFKVGPERKQEQKVLKCT